MISEEFAVSLISRLEQLGWTRVWISAKTRQLFRWPNVGTPCLIADVSKRDPGRQGTLVALRWQALPGVSETLFFREDIADLPEHCEGWFIDGVIAKVFLAERLGSPPCAYWKVIC